MLLSVHTRHSSFYNLLSTLSPQDAFLRKTSTFGTFLVAALLTFPLTSEAQSGQPVAASPENVPSFAGSEPSTENPESENPTVPECPLYTISVKSQGRYNDNLNVDVGSDAPSCLQPIIDSAVSECQSMSPAARSSCVTNVVGVSGAPSHVDDCVVLCKLYRSNPNNPLGADYLQANRGLGDGNHTLYFDASCDFDQAQDSKIFDDSCNDAGSIYYYYSPISLLWEKGADIESELSFVQFSLDPRKSGKWYEWKASEDTPLLVYDPSQSGVVRDASQLFGNWTFGGKANLAALSGGLAQKPTPWRDGYEALGTLDHDSDGAINGSELAPLALWFDKNQNGLSEEGEVRPVQELGVTALFYSPDSSDSVTKSIFASRGYERQFEGKTIRGASVDWYGAESNSPTELFGKLQLQAGCASSDTSNPLSDDFEFDAAAAVASESLTGAWLWETDRSTLSSGGGKGYLILEDRGKEGILGKSVLETMFKKSMERQTGLLQILSLEGQRELDAEGNVIVVFRMAPNNGTTSTSRARIRDNGQTLLGETETLIQDGKKTRKLRYSWKATKRSR